MRDLSDLRIKPLRRREGSFRSPTISEISNFEMTFGVRLPADYVAFLNRFNGGVPEKNTFDTASGYSTNVGRFFFLLPETHGGVDKRSRADSYNVWSETRRLRMAVGLNIGLVGLADVRDQMTDRIVSFAIDNGNASMFVFDYRTSQPKVCLAVASRGFSLIPLAESFSHFIDNLR